MKGFHLRELGCAGGGSVVTIPPLNATGLSIQFREFCPYGYAMNRVKVQLHNSSIRDEPIADKEVLVHRR